MIVDLDHIATMLKDAKRETLFVLEQVTDEDKALELIEKIFVAVCVSIGAGTVSFLAFMLYVMDGVGLARLLGGRNAVA